MPAKPFEAEQPAPVADGARVAICLDDGFVNLAISYTDGHYLSLVMTSDEARTMAGMLRDAAAMARIMQTGMTH